MWNGAMICNFVHIMVTYNGNEMLFRASYHKVLVVEMVEIEFGPSDRISRGPRPAV